MRGKSYAPAFTNPKWNSWKFPRFILKTAVAVMKHRPCFDPSTSSGSARTVFEVLTQLVKYPFALSSLRSGRVEGLNTYQLPFVGSSLCPLTIKNEHGKTDKTRRLKNLR